MDYILSIIIPTKNRYQYLKDCVLSLSSLDSKTVEIIVQDNSDDNIEFKRFLSIHDIPNLKYYHQTGQLSQTENSDLAVEKATGEYCCFIGDDDSVSTMIIPVAHFLKSRQIQACVCDVATYYWPDVVFSGSKRPPLSFDMTKAYSESLRSTHVLNQVLSYGIQDIKYLARVYHGIISRDVLLEVKEKTGSFFPGPSPDMANAISCTSIIQSYVYIHLPLIISGYSYKSAGGMGLRGAHKGRLQDSKQLPSNVEDDWDPKIPKLWLGYTMWPQSGLSALNAMRRVDLTNQMNYFAMYAKTFLKYPEYRKNVLSFMHSIKDYILFVYEVIRFGIRWSLDRLKLKIRIASKQQFISWEQTSLCEAQTIVDKVLKNTNINAL